MAIQSPMAKRPFQGKKKHSTHHVTEVSDEDDIDAVDETDEEYFECDWNEEGDDDPDQVAYIDEEGWFYADEETINAVDEGIA